MHTKQDLQNKVKEIMDIVYKPVDYWKVSNHETANLYEYKLRDIAEKCGSLTVLIEHLNIE